MSDEREVCPACGYDEPEYLVPTPQVGPWVRCSRCHWTGDFMELVTVRAGDAKDTA